MDIVSFKHKGLQRFFEREESRGLSQDRIKKLRQILTAIDSAETLDELDTMPGWRLHELHGNRAGTWSIVVTGNYRLTFTIEDEQVHDVDLEDYH
ncbi:MAG: type II toxin-antitoxin system RelE/ParE family toxin [Proteobacteria bacterium]|nr:type II toxin-antitoxin system RelE/ParE family toxin [Pseudomonadota bacterium]